MTTLGMLALLAGPPVPAQQPTVAARPEPATTWNFVGGAALATARGPDAAATLQGPRAHTLAGPHGDCVIHFGANAAGKPASLAIAVPAGAEVQVAAPAAGPAASTPWVLATLAPRSAAGGWLVQLDPAAEQADGRWEATVEPAAGTSHVALVARVRGDDQLYRLVWDLAANELRLERRLGNHELLLRRAALPPRPGARRLTMQAQGFRLQAWCDDELLLQCFDGALTRGSWGIGHRGDAPAWRDASQAAPATTLASSVLVQHEGTATCHAMTGLAPGHWYWFQLVLDRPHPLVPRQFGFEPWLLQRSAEPIVPVDGNGPWGLVELDGSCTATLPPAMAPCLRGQCVLVRALLATPDGGVWVGSTPAVPMRF